MQHLSIARSLLLALVAMTLALALEAATIVMLTAAHCDSVEPDAEQAGADLFLTKPFSPLELLLLVDRLGERQPR